MGFLYTIQEYYKSQKLARNLESPNITLKYKTIEVNNLQLGP